MWTPPCTSIRDTSVCDVMESTDRDVWDVDAEIHRNNSAIGGRIETFCTCARNYQYAKVLDKGISGHSPWKVVISNNKQNVM